MYLYVTYDEYLYYLVLLICSDVLTVLLTESSAPGTVLTWVRGRGQVGSLVHRIGAQRHWSLRFPHRLGRWKMRKWRSWNPLEPVTWFFGNVGGTTFWYHDTIMILKILTSTKHVGSCLMIFLNNWSSLLPCGRIGFWRPGAMRDYATDRRGDVGSWVREVAMEAGSLWASPGFTRFHPVSLGCFSSLFSICFINLKWIEKHISIQLVL